MMQNIKQCHVIAVIHTDMNGNLVWGEEAYERKVEILVFNLSSV